jgi:hypothetical protein
MNIFYLNIIYLFKKKYINEKMRVKNINIINNESKNKSHSKGKKIILTDKKINKNKELYLKTDNYFSNKKLNKKDICTEKKISKSSLKGSKMKIEQKKKMILKTIEDNLKLDKIFFIQDKNDLFLNNSLLEAQTTYEIEMDNLYKEKIEKLNDINERYDDDIFELKNEVEEDEKNNKEKNNIINEKHNNDNNHGNIISSDDNYSVKLVYTRLIDDKNKEIENVNKEYEKRINMLYNKYINNFEFEDLEEKNMIYKNQIYENIRIKINDIMNPTNNKKVQFKFDTDINDNSKNTSSTEMTI